MSSAAICSFRAAWRKRNDTIRRAPRDMGHHWMNFSMVGTIRSNHITKAKQTQDPESTEAMGVMWLDIISSMILQTSCSGKCSSPPPSSFTSVPMWYPQHWHQALHSILPPVSIMSIDEIQYCSFHLQAKSIITELLATRQKYLQTVTTRANTTYSGSQEALEGVWQMHTIDSHLPKPKLEWEYAENEGW